MAAPLALLTLLIASAGARAQTVTVDSIAPVLIDLGKVVPATGNTTFRLGTGAITKLGTGVWTSTTGAFLVTVGCAGGGKSACGDLTTTVTLAAAGSPSGRALALTNFTAAPGPNSPTMGPRNGTSNVTFTVTGIARGTTRNFYVGFDFIIPDSGATGVSIAGFSASVPGSSQPATIRATVLRPIGVAWQSDLAFGNIVKPTNGQTNTVIINETTGAATLGGTGNGALPAGTRSRATFEVSGEGAQTFSVTAPTSVVMNGSRGGTLTASLVKSSATGTIGGTLANPGTATIGVGGTIPVSGTTTAGTYSGTFQVTVQYN